LTIQGHIQERSLHR